MKQRRTDTQTERRNSDRTSFRDGSKFASSSGQRQNPGGAAARQTAEDNRRGQSQVIPVGRLGILDVLC